MEEPKDLGVKIVSKEEALWTKVKEEATSLIQFSESNLVIQKAMLELAEHKLKDIHLNINNKE